MPRRLTRKQIKHDDFVSLVDRGMHWAGVNWRRAAVVLAAVLGLAMVWWIASLIMGGRASSASDALGKAIAAYNAPAGSAAPAGATVKFATDTQRLAEAEKQFKEVTSHYWATSQARMAQLFLARIAVDRGDQAGAIRLFSELASKRSADPLVRLATLDLIRLRIAKGEGMELVRDLEGMASGQDPRLPRDLAIFELAQVWERAGKNDEAAKLFRKIVEDFPESPYKFEAQQRLAAAS